MNRYVTGLALMLLCLTGTAGPLRLNVKAILSIQ